jgi:hypothetical protein
MPGILSEGAGGAMSRWSDAFHALTPPLTHETHGDTCAAAGSHTDLPDPAQVSSSVPCVAAANRVGRGIAWAGNAARRRSCVVKCPMCQAGGWDRWGDPCGGCGGPAGRRRPPAWSGAAALPSAGAWCSCCRGQRWWSEARDPKGWRCHACHPPTHLGANNVRDVRT